MARDPQVMRYIANGEIWSDGRIGWFMGRQSVLQETLGYCNWKLIERSSGDFVGFCGLAPLASVGEVEIGWWLKPAFWRRGLASEAGACVVRAAFSAHALPRIVARIYRANAASVTLAGRLGMTFDRVFDHGPAGEIDLYRLEAPSC